MTFAADMVATIERSLAYRAMRGIPTDKIMMSLKAFADLKKVVPRKQYRQRKGTRFINAYAGVPIELHDEWSWGWMLAPTPTPTQSAAA